MLTDADVLMLIIRYYSWAREAKVVVVAIGINVESGFVRYNAGLIMVITMECWSDNGNNTGMLALLEIMMRWRW